MSSYDGPLSRGAAGLKCETSGFARTKEYRFQDIPGRALMWNWLLSGAGGGHDPGGCSGLRSGTRIDFRDGAIGLVVIIYYSLRPRTHAALAPRGLNGPSLA